MIYGLVGLKGSGKSTVFGLISKQLGEYKVAEVMLASKLKDVCSAVFKFKREDCEILAEKERQFDTPIILTEAHIHEILWKFAIASAKNLELSYLHAGHELVSIRNILQFVGTEMLRALDPDIHVKSVNSSDGKILVVTDIRFQNELDYFKSQKGFVSIAIVRPSMKFDIADLHPSEANIPHLQKQVDYTICNTCLNDLPALVSEIVNPHYDRLPQW